MSGMADGAVLRLRPDAATWRAEDGETVVLDLDRAWYLGLNRSGTVLWQALATGTDQAALAGLLRQHYDVDEAIAERDAAAFVAECRRRGLLQA